MNNKKIFFSVVIPLYNKKKYILKSVNSVLNQTYDNFELIIVNDGSTDGSLEELKHIKDNRLKIFNKENGGVSSARNFGIKESFGDYVAFLDADDEWSIDFLNTINSMCNLYPNKGMYCTSYKVNYDHSMKNVQIKNEQEVFLINDYLEDFFKIKAWPNHQSSTVIKTELLFLVGLYNEKLINCEDINLYLKIYLCSEIVYSTKILGIYNLFAAELSNATINYNHNKILDKQFLFFDDINEFIKKHNLDRKLIDSYNNATLLKIIIQAFNSKEFILLNSLCNNIYIKNYLKLHQKIFYISKLNKIFFIFYKIIKKYV